MLEALKEELLQFHLELRKNDLVSWTSGNISGRDRATNLVVIKPSGVRYEELTRDSMVVVDLHGKVIEGNLKPSVDCATHLFVYRNRADLYGIVHTHSPYATAFAALGRSIPAVLTAMADEFGGPIPCSSYAAVGGEAIGEQIVQTIGKGTAVLLKNHGPFTVGTSVQSAVKAAIMLESIARTVHLAYQIGEPRELPQTELERAHRQYKDHYGQASSHAN